ncbi:unnamed protein product [Amoebophrya sp. A25]|nr:unnamed protein product [Amoebophrya sp. A25]|eukprot:GSA25T00022849001.1
MISTSSKPQHQAEILFSLSSPFFGPLLKSIDNNSRKHPSSNYFPAQDLLLFHTNFRSC